MRLPQTPDGTSCDQAEKASMGTANKRESKAEEDMPGSPARFCGVFLWGKPCWDGGPLRAEQIWEAPLRVKPFMEVPLVQGIWQPRGSLTAIPTVFEPTSNPNSLIWFPHYF